MTVLRLLLDHNVPDSVAQVFRERGHIVQLVRDILPTDSPDQLIATVGEEDGSILVTCDRDFRLMAPRIRRGARSRFQRLSRISLECREPQAAQRIRVALSLIEAEYEIAQNSPDGQMFIVVQGHGIKTHR
jgi:predicted nuclease of predicted toxin-antitoxin system